MMRDFAKGNEGGEDNHGKIRGVNGYSSKICNQSGFNRCKKSKLPNFFNSI